MRKIWVVGLSVAAAGVLFVGCEDVNTSGSGAGGSTPGHSEKATEAPKKSSADDDVKLVKCGTDDYGQFPQAELKVTNRSSETSNYLIQVEFLDGDGTRKAEGTAALNNLAPDQSADEKAVGLSKAPADLTCKITKVSRYASP
jgi:hypothetical protein